MRATIASIVHRYTSWCDIQYPDSSVGLLVSQIQNFAFIPDWVTHQLTALLPVPIGTPVERPRQLPEESLPIMTLGTINASLGTRS